jgi:hypothetical protein
MSEKSQDNKGGKRKSIRNQGRRNGIAKRETERRFREK